MGFEAGNKPKELYSEEAVNGETQQAHLQAIKELIARDKNHPSVAMWSIANEPDTRPQGARRSRHWRKQRVNSTHASDHLRQCNVLRRSHRYHQRSL
ncbi:glycoside hydrolase family 2 TIM barrel-domain containing protein [Escherichia coli]